MATHLRLKRIETDGGSKHIAGESYVADAKPEARAQDMSERKSAYASERYILNMAFSPNLILQYAYFQDISSSFTDLNRELKCLGFGK